MILANVAHQVAHQPFVGLLLGLRFVEVVQRLVGFLHRAERPFNFSLGARRDPLAVLAGRDVRHPLDAQRLHHILENPALGDRAVVEVDHQVQLHLTLALEAGYQTGEKPVTAALVETVLSRQLDDLEPTLTRHGYRLKDMVEQFDASLPKSEPCSTINSSRRAPLSCATVCLPPACLFDLLYDT